MADLTGYKVVRLWPDGTITSVAMWQPDEHFPTNADIKVIYGIEKRAFPPLGWGPLAMWEDSDKGLLTARNFCRLYQPLIGKLLLYRCLYTLSDIKELFYIDITGHKRVPDADVLATVVYASSILLEGKPISKVRIADDDRFGILEVNNRAA